VSDGSHFALQDMSNAIKRSVVSTYLNVPEPLIASDAVAAVMYPWRAFISRYVHSRRCIQYGDGAGNTLEENSSVFSLIQMR